MRFQHDCQKCTDLGEFGDFDLYYCNQADLIPTVIARYGDKPHDYYSGLGTKIVPLKEAERRAEKLGLELT